MMMPPDFEIKDEPDGDDSQSQDELEELRNTVQGIVEKNFKYLRIVSAVIKILISFI